jgi:RHS repeat-associated protein
VDHTYSYGAGLLHDSAGNTVYTPGFSQRKSGTDAFFHTDWIGSTRYLTAGNGLGIPTGYRFDAFGNQSAGAGIDQTSLKFAGAWGYQSDVAMHLQLLGARYYDPEVGRFLSPDPIGFLDGLNLYQYARNNPVGVVDPTGLFGDESIVAYHFMSEEDRRIGWAGVVGYGRFLLRALDPGVGAVTGQDPLTGEKLTAKQRVVTALLAIRPLRVLKIARKPKRAADGCTSPTLRPGSKMVEELGPELNKKAKDAFKDKAKLQELTMADRLKAAEQYDWLADNVTSKTLPKLTAAFNRDRARYLRGEVDHIAKTAREYAAEKGLPLE